MRTSRIAGLRVNIWMSIVTVVVTVTWLVATGHRAKRADPVATGDQPEQHVDGSA